MCGIAGFIDFNKRSDSHLVEKMAAAIPHRGPDGQGIYFNQTNQADIGLGHRRLSIIDLSHAADQPMHFDGLHIIFNGEIYNYAEIKETLISLGHSFQTHSDTEVILHAWREWGEKAIRQWRGMFAIALYDERNQQLICIRDRAGVKPFYYFFKERTFLFSSELKSLMKHPDFEKSINVDALGAFLQYNYVPSPYSIFKDTFKLPAGHLLKLDLHSSSLDIKQYWDVYEYYNKPKLSIGLPEAISETERILAESFQYRMVADVPVGVFLSGGYDSTCVTALLQHSNIERIKTFTIGSTDQKLNEAPFAKQIAAHLGTNHTEYYCSPKEALDIIPELPFYYDEPFADPSAIPTILVSRMARKEVTVALSADAGDEIFAGYNRYDYISRFGNRLRAIPHPMRKMVASAMENISSDKIPFFRDQRNFHSRYDKLKNLLRDPSASELLKNLTQVFSQLEINRLFNQPVRVLNTAHSSNELLKKYYDPLSFMMAIDYKTYMVDDILQKVDRATMSVSLEGREPFLDQHIIEWAAQLPSDYKYFKGQKKYILKQIVHKYVPKEIMERPKMGFGIPVEKWLADELKPLVMEYLSPEKVKVHGFFNAEEVGNICTDFYNGRKEKHLKIWHILMFQMWYEKWMVQ
jgi:asparagine synthase (glutamine-hydrolysing)